MRVKAGCNDSLALSQEKLMVLRDIYIIYMYYFTTTQGEEFDPPPSPGALGDCWGGASL